jgi:hypothetical protein
MIDRIGSGTQLYFSGPFTEVARAYIEAERLGLLVHSSRTDGDHGSFTAVLKQDMPWGQFTRMIDLLTATEHGAAASGVRS